VPHERLALEHLGSDSKYLAEGFSGPDAGTREA
jgi:hypothetical protein